MASQPKSTSRWGSLLQQAVAGVESRLDTILADDEKSPKPSTNNAGQPTKREATSVPVATNSSTDVSRRPSTTKKTNSRLQERLAKAVVARSGATSTNTSQVPSRSTSPTKIAKSPRSSIDSKAERNENLTDDNVSNVARASIDSGDNVDTTYREIGEGRSRQLSVPHLEADSLGRLSTDSHDTSSWRHSTESNQAEINGIPRLSTDTMPESTSSVPAGQSAELVEQMRSDHEAAELRRQEETHRYLEHIDALQAKLQYLTKEALEAAKRRSSEAEPGGLDQQLAIKDEKIALLMEEGQKLSETELKHMTTIKKLRSKASEDEKRIKRIEKRANDLERSTRIAQDKARQAEALQQEDRNKVKILQKAKDELGQIHSELERKDAIIADLRDQLSRALDSRDSTESSKYKELLEKEKKLVSELRDDLSNAKVEKELADERHRKQYRELQEKAERQKERYKIAELELKGEIGVLESRLESFRIRAEEVSTGSSGDTQAKLLRQIETLQTQYSVASENWRGIEGSLLARITNLETERNDITKREADIRAKARKSGTKIRQLEDQIEQVTVRKQELETELMECNKKLTMVHEACCKAEKEVKKLQNKLSSERDLWQARLEERLEAERKDFQPHAHGSVSPQLRMDIPSVSGRQKLVPEKTDKASPHSRRLPSSSGHGLTSATLPYPDRPVSRRHSGQPSQISGNGIALRQDSRSSTPQLFTVNGNPESPFTQREPQDDFFDGVVTPATPDRTINDMFSVSTAAAGPSLQLVERMSAAVRRLESEKATLKDELDRLSVQRDEAREQVVALMREVEEKRASDAKVHELQAQVTEINQRYEATLEMLGEKSELVDELKADVADLKQMYRDLVDSTMR